MTNVQNRISQVISEKSNLEFDIFKAVLNEAIQKQNKTALCSCKSSSFFK